MKFHELYKFGQWRSGAVLAAISLGGALAAAGQQNRSILIFTSTNSASGNAVVAFKLNTGQIPSLSLQETLPTGGIGGAGGNAGILQFQNGFGAVANYGSNTVTQFARYDDFILMTRTIGLARDCVKPDSVALTQDRIFIVGTKCAESHAWPWGYLDGPVVSLSDKSAGQIALGNTWAAVTMTSGSLLQLPLASNGGFTGTSNAVTLPSDANNTPLGAAFWGNILGFNPAHSPDSFALVDENANVSPIAGPTPSFPTNAPCWVAKGPLSIWYTANSPGAAVSIFFTDGQGGAFYKSVPLPGSPTDITVSSDNKWLAVIYTAGDQAHVAVFSIDELGDLTAVATSGSMNVAAFSGVAISE
jgi:hypothetical protein